MGLAASAVAQLPLERKPQVQWAWAISSPLRQRALQLARQAFFVDCRLDRNATLVEMGLFHRHGLYLLAALLAMRVRRQLVVCSV